jgi:hypothetical protein
MMMWLLCILAVEGLQPDRAQLPELPSTLSWRLDVEFHDPQRINIRLPGDTFDSTFWYLLYQVTNNNNADVDFYPSVRLVTDTLQVVEAGTGIHPLVYDKIAERHEREYPFLAPPAKVTGRLLQGEENSRASVAVFQPFDPQASSFTIFATGFSGEMHRIPNPTFDPEKGDTEENVRAFLLRRTLAIVYDLPGDSGTRQFATPLRRTREWVMR